MHANIKISWNVGEINITYYTKIINKNNLNMWFVCLNVSRKEK